MAEWDAGKEAAAARRRGGWLLVGYLALCMALVAYIVWRWLSATGGTF